MNDFEHKLINEIKELVKSLGEIQKSLVLIVDSLNGGIK